MSWRDAIFALDSAKAELGDEAPSLEILERAIAKLRSVEAIRVDEREACAKLLEDEAQQIIDENDEPLGEELEWAVQTRQRLADKIRARGATTPVRS